MNHGLRGYYILFGIIIGELKGLALLQFSQHMGKKFPCKLLLVMPNTSGTNIDVHNKNKNKI